MTKNKLDDADTIDTLTPFAFTAQSVATILSVGLLCSCKRWSRLQATLWPEPRVHAQFVSFFRGNVGTLSLQGMYVLTDIRGLGGTAETKTENAARDRRRVVAAIRNPKILRVVEPAATP